MDGEHLHRLGIGLQPAAALLVGGSPWPRRSGCAATRSARWCPSCSCDAAACSSCPMWRRSVSRRSPRARPGPGRARPSVRVIVSSSAATPRAQHPGPIVQRRWTSSQPRSRPRRGARRSADQPKNGVSAAVWARRPTRGAPAPRAGRSQSRADSVPNTLPAPLITAGTPAASSASRTIAAWRLVRTSTARCPGGHRLGSGHSLPGAVALLDRSAGRRAARRHRPRGPADVLPGAVGWAYPGRVRDIAGLSRSSTRTAAEPGRGRADASRHGRGRPGPGGRRSAGGRA